MDKRIEQIRQNLVAASAALNSIYPRPPDSLIQEINASWTRYQQLSASEEAKQTPPGKPDNLGILPLVIAGVVGLAAVMGGSAYIAHELNESDRLKKLSECIADATRSGTPLATAQKACEELYGGKGLISVETGTDLGTIALLGILGLGGVLLVGKMIK